MRQIVGDVLLLLAGIAIGARAYGAPLWLGLCAPPCLIAYLVVVASAPGPNDP